MEAVVIDTIKGFEGLIQYHEKEIEKLEQSFEHSKVACVVIDDEVNINMIKKTQQIILETIQMHKNLQAYVSTVINEIKEENSK